MKDSSPLSSFAASRCYVVAPAFGGDGPGDVWMDALASLEAGGVTFPRSSRAIGFGNG